MLGGRGTVGVVVVLLLLAGCGSSNTKPIPGGVASGAGFSVRLPTGWRSFDQVTQSQIFRQSYRQLRAKGVPGHGVLEAGHWINPSSPGEASLVVDVEPVTPDTAEATLDQEQSRLLRQAGATDVRLLSSPTAVDRVTVTAFAYRLGDFNLRAFSARRGIYLYSITIGAKDGQMAAVDGLLATMVKSWHWSTTDVPELSQLQHYSGRGYRVTLPPGWTGAGSSDAALAGVRGADSLWTGYADASGRSIAAVLERPSSNVTLDELVAQELRSGGKREADEQVGGADAAVLDMAARGAHIHEWVTLHGGREYAIVVRTTDARRARDDGEVRQALDSWQFTS